MTPGRAAIALSCGALALLSGCGSDSNGKPIPASQADRLINNIEAADSYSSDGRCVRAHTKVRDARFVLGQIPNSVDKDVRRELQIGIARLDTLITSQCQPPERTNTDTTPTTATDTTPTQTETTQTETTQTDTTQTQTQTTPTNTVPTSTTPTQTGTGTTPTPGNGGSPTSTGATGGTGGDG